MEKEDKKVYEMPYGDGEKLVVSYSEKRAKKDAYNRNKGVERLRKSFKREKAAQGGLSVAGGCRCLTKDGNTSIEKEGYIPYPLQA